MLAQGMMVLDAMPMALGMGLAGLLGLIFGSFIAALVVRWPQNKGLGGRSHCDHCGAKLGARDLIPLLSRAMLRGKSRCCGQAIDPFYSRVEAAGAGIGVLALALMPGISGWIWAVMGWMLLPLILLDARHHWLPDRLNFALAAAGLILAGPLMGVDFDSRWIGAAAAGLILLLLRLGYRALRGREGMGGGDPKLFAAIGAWLGWQALPMLLLIASFGGIAWAIVGHKKGNRPIGYRRVPFGVFLGIGGWMTALIFPLIAV